MTVAVCLATAGTDKNFKAMEDIFVALAKRSKFLSPEIRSKLDAESRD